MAHPLTEVTGIDIAVESCLRETGEVFQVFQVFLHQDSWTTSYGVLVGDRRWFVKAPDDPDIIDFTPEQRYGDPVHPQVRFRSMPIPEILGALDMIFDVHALVAEHGFVASDLYDGCIVYDFKCSRTFLCDFDEYRTGLFVPKEGPGLRVHALHGPRGVPALRDNRPGHQLFNLGRDANMLLGAGTASLAPRKRTYRMKAVAVRATDPDRTQRHHSVPKFVHEWRAAVSDS